MENVNHSVNAVFKDVDFCKLDHNIVPECDEEVCLLLCAQFAPKIKDIFKNYKKESSSLAVQSAGEGLLDMLNATQKWSEEDKQEELTDICSQIKWIIENPQFIKESHVLESYGIDIDDIREVSSVKDLVALWAEHSTLIQSMRYYSMKTQEKYLKLLKIFATYMRDQNELITKQNIEKYVDRNIIKRFFYRLGHEEPFDEYLLNVFKSEVMMFSFVMEWVIRAAWHQRINDSDIAVKSLYYARLAKQFVSEHQQDYNDWNTLLSRNSQAENAWEDAYAVFCSWFLYSTKCFNEDKLRNFVFLIYKSVYESNSKNLFHIFVNTIDGVDELELKFFINSIEWPNRRRVFMVRYNEYLSTIPRTPLFFENEINKFASTNKSDLYLSTISALIDNFQLKQPEKDEDYEQYLQAFEILFEKLKEGDKNILRITETVTFKSFVFAFTGWTNFESNYKIAFEGQRGCITYFLTRMCGKNITFADVQAHCEIDKLTTKTFSQSYGTLGLEKRNAINKLIGDTFKHCK